MPPRWEQLQNAGSGYSDGLLQWGGHRFFDLNTLTVVGEQDAHELKSNYPFYELMWEVDPDATARYIRAMWNAHILDWSKLDMNRHGKYDTLLGKLWDHEYEHPEPFFEGDGLTFINTGSDMIYAAGLLHHFTGEEGALTWGMRMAKAYVDARDPVTGLGVYQYSQLRRGADRACIQLGPEFGELALEGRFLPPSRAGTIYGRAATVQLRLAETLGDAGEDLLGWIIDGLRAYAQYAYEPETNELIPMFTDGTIVTPDDYRREGYYSASTFNRGRAGTSYLLSYAIAYRLTGDPILWETTRAMAQGNGLGDWGVKPGEGVVFGNIESADPVALFSVLEIYRATDNDVYLELAQQIAANIVAHRFYHGFFLPTADHIHANF